MDPHPVSIGRTLTLTMHRWFPLHPVPWPPGIFKFNQLWLHLFPIFTFLLFLFHFSPWHAQVFHVLGAGIKHELNRKVSDRWRRHPSCLFFKELCLECLFICLQQIARGVTQGFLVSDVELTLTRRCHNNQPIDRWELLCTKVCIFLTDPSYSLKFWTLSYFPTMSKFFFWIKISAIVFQLRS